MEERLAACLNVTACAADEMLATFKITPALATALAARIAGLHPYELPVIEWSWVAATGARCDWVRDALRG